jgi:hypothetical protein
MYDSRGLFYVDPEMATERVPRWSNALRGGGLDVDRIRANLPQVEELICDSIRGGIGSLRQLANLRVLCVERWALADPEDLKGLHSITAVRVGGGLNAAQLVNILHLPRIQYIEAVGWDPVDSVRREPIVPATARLHGLYLSGVPDPEHERYVAQLGVERLRLFSTETFFYHDGFRSVTHASFQRAAFARGTVYPKPNLRFLATLKLEADHAPLPEVAPNLEMLAVDEDALSVTLAYLRGVARGSRWMRLRCIAVLLRRPTDIHVPFSELKNFIPGLQRIFLANVREVDINGQAVTFATPPVDVGGVGVRVGNPTVLSSFHVVCGDVRLLSDL